jgi:hypothetical protein
VLGFEYPIMRHAILPRIARPDPQEPGETNRLKIELTGQFATLLVCLLSPVLPAAAAVEDWRLRQKPKVSLSDDS